MTERVEVLANDGSVARIVPREEMRAKRLRHRCTFVLIRSSNHDVLVHRRSDDKDLWPSRWDLSVGGVVTAGEDWVSAALRELSEEVGVTAARVDLEYLGERTYVDEDVDELARIWTTVHDGPFEFNDGEVVEARMVSLDELAEMLRQLPFVPDSAKLVAPLLVGNRGTDAAD